MKTLLLSLMLTIFAAAAYAGDCDGSSCCSKATSTQQTKASSCPNGAKMTKANKKNATAKQTLQSPKAMSLASR